MTKPAGQVREVERAFAIARMPSAGLEENSGCTTGTRCRTASIEASLRPETFKDGGKAIIFCRPLLCPLAVQSLNGGRFVMSLVLGFGAVSSSLLIAQ